MNCHQDLHDGLKEEGEILCPFCGFKLQDPSIVNEHCCDNEDSIGDLGHLVCRNCGQVHGYDIVQEYIDFHENMFKIRNKSIYQRKYHVENIIMDVCAAARIEITRDEIYRICKVFDEIGKIISQVDGRRKRIISCKFILREIFKMMGKPCRNIRITKSKRTASAYRQFWMRTM